MSGSSAGFIGSIPKDYDGGLGPVIFADYATAMAQRVVARETRDILETACGTGIVTSALCRGPPGDAKVMVTDLNADMLSVAQGKRPRAGRWSSGSRRDGLAFRR